MKILVACEFSGIVREAFRARGHDAWSCDILPTEQIGNHIQGDVLEVLNEGWDMMIAFPPCTYLSYVGNRYWDTPGRAEKRIEALQFFMKFVHAPIDKICIENPTGLMNTIYRKPDQIVEPYYFGDSAKKRTCLWLKNLSPLAHSPVPTLFGSQTHCAEPEPMYYLKTNGKAIHWTEGVHGGHTRSKSWSGISRAMAEQWG